MPRPKKTEKILPEVQLALRRYTKLYPTKTSAVNALACKVGISATQMYKYGIDSSPSMYTARALALEALGANVSVEWQEPEDEKYKELSDKYKTYLEQIGWRVTITPPDAEKQD